MAAPGPDPGARAGLMLRLGLIGGTGLNQWGEALTSHSITSDYGDCSADLEEFEIAQFPDEAIYVRVALPTTRFIKTHVAAGNDVTGKADEPHIFGVIGCTCFARQLNTIHPYARRRSAINNTAHH